MPDLRARAERARYVFYSLSGGRDSQAALELTYSRYVDEGKRVEVLYVDNGSELAGTREHAEAVAASVGAQLTVLPGKTFFEVYDARGRWPNSIHKDCVEALINRPIDLYCRSVANGEDYVLVRGGRPTQRNLYSGSAAYQVVKGKPGMIIHNPLYETPDYDAQGPLWPGYALGYARTRCWCCPFALISDWEVLRVQEPEKWEAMRQAFARLEWRAYRGDGYLRRIQKYWEGEHGVPVRYSRPPDRRVTM